MLHPPFRSFLLHGIPTHKHQHQQRTSPPYWPQLCTTHRAFLRQTLDVFLSISQEEIWNQPTLQWFLIFFFFLRVIMWPFHMEFHVNWLQSVQPPQMWYCDVSQLLFFITYCWTACTATQTLEGPIKHPPDKKMFCLLLLNYPCLTAVSLNSFHLFIYSSIYCIYSSAFVIQPI